MIHLWAKFQPPTTSGRQWTNRLNEDVTLSLSARRTLFGSPTDPYNESALVANLTVQF